MKTDEKWHRTIKKLDRSFVNMRGCAMQDLSGFTKKMPGNEENCQGSGQQVQMFDDVQAIVRLVRDFMFRGTAPETVPKPNAGQALEHQPSLR